MFNYVNNNPFGQRIESAVSTGQEHKQRQQQQQDKEKKYLEDEDNDEVSLAPLPENWINFYRNLMRKNL